MIFFCRHIGGGGRVIGFWCERGCGVLVDLGRGMRCWVFSGLAFENGFGKVRWEVGGVN